MTVSELLVISISRSSSTIALSWFKDHFIKCNERAALVKTWLPAQYDGPKSWLDQLVYDRALLLVRIQYNSLRRAFFANECCA